MRGLGFFFWWRKGSEREVEVGRKGGVAEQHDDASLGGVSLGQRSAWMALRLDGAMLGGFFSLSLLFLYLCATLCTALSFPFAALCSTCVRVLKIIPAYGRGIACYCGGSLPPPPCVRVLKIIPAYGIGIACYCGGSLFPLVCGY